MDKAKRDDLLDKADGLDTTLDFIGATESVVTTLYKFTTALCDGTEGVRLAFDQFRVQAQRTTSGNHHAVMREAHARREATILAVRAIVSKHIQHAALELEGIRDQHLLDLFEDGKEVSRAPRRIRLKDEEAPAPAPSVAAQITALLNDSDTSGRVDPSIEPEILF